MTNTLHFGGGKLTSSNTRSGYYPLVSNLRRMFYLRFDLNLAFRRTALPFKS